MTPRAILEPAEGESSIPFPAAARFTAPGWSLALVHVYEMAQFFSLPVTRIEITSAGSLWAEISGVPEDGEARRYLNQITDSTLAICETCGDPGRGRPIPGSPQQLMTCCPECWACLRDGARSWLAIAKCRTAGKRGSWTPDQDREDDERDGIPPEDWKGE